MLSQELEAIPSNQVAVNTLHSPLTDDDITVYYATDLHINHTLGNMPDNISIFDKLESLASNLSVQGVLLLGGDMSDNSVLNKRFLYRLKNCFTHIIYVLGNHEYWQFESVREAEDYYRGICSEHLILLNNSIVYFTTEYADGYYGSCKLPIRFVLRPHILSNEQLLSMSVKQIQGTLSAARLVIFGELGLQDTMRQVRSAAYLTVESIVTRNWSNRNCLSIYTGNYCLSFRILILSYLRICLSLAGAWIRSTILA